MPKKNLSNQLSELVFEHNLPNLFVDALHHYFRIEIEGIENIPKKGAAIIAPNHSGFAGLDALILAREINKNLNRIPRVLTHKFWFLSKFTAESAQKIGFIEASMKNALDQLKKNNLVLIFPEGENGNFKSTFKKYHLQEFRRGFIRMAIEAQCPVVPTLVIGAEESNFNLKKIRIFGKQVLPIPLNLIPFPAKWKIIFLEPIHLPYKKEYLDDFEAIEELASEIRENMQQALSQEVSRRKSVFFG